MRRRGRRRNEVHRRPRPEDRPVDPVQRPGRFPYMAVYLVSDERIDVPALVSVRRGSKPPLPAGQTSSRRHCSPQIVRKKSNCGPQQPSAADHRISVLSQVSTGEPLRRLAVAREDSVSVRHACGLVTGHALGGRWLVFVPVEPRILCGACEPVGQHGAEGTHGNRGLLLLSTSVRLPIFSALPGTDIRRCWKGANCHGSYSSAVCWDRCVQA